MKIQRPQNEGVVLLVTLLVMAILLALSASILNITLKQYQIAGIALASERAFQAANAGIECALYHDTAAATELSVSGDHVFDVGKSPTGIGCFETSSNSSASDPIGSTEEQQYQFDWGSAGSPPLCTEFSIYKFHDPTSDVPLNIGGVSVRADDCIAGSTCTVIKSRGYNVACGDLSTNPKVVERELTLIY